MSCHLILLYSIILCDYPPPWFAGRGGTFSPRASGRATVAPRRCVLRRPASPALPSCRSIRRVRCLATRISVAFAVLCFDEISTMQPSARDNVAVVHALRGGRVSWKARCRSSPILRPAGPRTPFGVGVARALRFAVAAGRTGPTSTPPSISPAAPPPTCRNDSPRSRSSSSRSRTASQGAPPFFAAVGLRRI